MHLALDRHVAKPIQPVKSPSAIVEAASSRRSRILDPDSLHQQSQFPEHAVQG